MTTGIHEAHYDWSVQSPSTAVVEAVAAASGRDPTDFESLYERTDPDALDALLSPRKGQPARDVQVTLTLSGYRVTADSGGRVVVRPVGAD